MMAQSENSNTQQEQFVLDYTGQEINQRLAKVSALEQKVAGLEEAVPLTESEINIIMA